MPSSVDSGSTASILREDRVFIHALFAFEKQSREDDVMMWARSVSCARRAEKRGRARFTVAGAEESSSSSSRSRSSSSSSSSGAEEKTSKEENRKSRKKRNADILRLRKNRKPGRNKERKAGHGSRGAELALTTSGRNSWKSVGTENCVPWEQGEFRVSAVRQDAVVLSAAVPPRSAFDPDDIDDLALPSDMGADYKLYQQRLAGTGTASIVSMHPYQCASIVHVARATPSSTPTPPPPPTTTTTTTMTTEQKSIWNVTTPSQRTSQTSSTVETESETQGHFVTPSKEGLLSSAIAVPVATTAPDSQTRATPPPKRQAPTAPLIHTQAQAQALHPLDLSSLDTTLPSLSLTLTSYSPSTPRAWTPRFPPSPVPICPGPSDADIEEFLTRREEEAKRRRRQETMLKVARRWRSSKRFVRAEHNSLDDMRRALSGRDARLSLTGRSRSRSRSWSWSWGWSEHGDVGVDEETSNPPSLPSIPAPALLLPPKREQLYTTRPLPLPRSTLTSPSLRPTTPLTPLSRPPHSLRKSLLKLRRKLQSWLRCREGRRPGRGARRRGVRVRMRGPERGRNREKGDKMNCRVSGRGGSTAGRLSMHGEKRGRYARI